MRRLPIPRVADRPDGTYSWVSILGPLWVLAQPHTATHAPHTPCLGLTLCVLTQRRADRDPPSPQDKWCALAFTYNFLPASVAWFVAHVASVAVCAALAPADRTAIGLEYRLTCYVGTVLLPIAVQAR